MSLIYVHLNRVINKHGLDVMYITGSRSRRPCDRGERVSRGVRASGSLRRSDPRAADAVALFVYRIGRELGSLAAALGGLDAVVFTGGIGENAAKVRAGECRDAAWLGVELDESANIAGASRISREGSRVTAWALPTNEELMIARLALRLLELR